MIKGFIATHGWFKIIMFSMLLAIGTVYGVFAIRGEQTRSQLVQVNRFIEGTPGEPGVAGLRGAGIKSVSIGLLPPGSNPQAILKNEHLLLRLPSGRTGARGRKGATGSAGIPSASVVATAVAKFCATHSNCRGPKGGIGPQGHPGITNVEAAINQFMATHTFVCTRVGPVWTCVVAGRRG